jgi:hypothetical protein
MACKIDHIEWGKIIVQDETFKDVIICNDHVEEWDWRKCNTKHDPGIQMSDVIQIIDTIDDLILSTGFENKLKVKPETIRFIEYKKKIYYVLETSEAVKKYNELINNGHRVGALIHSTC